MGRWEADRNRDVLERIVALLFALAGLADLASNLSVLRRRHVLGILSRGEAEARAFVVGISAGAPAPEGAPDTACDAARLASRLRALALVLCVVLARRFGLPGAAGPRARQPVVRGLDAPAPTAPDTS